MKKFVIRSICLITGFIILVWLLIARPILPGSNFSKVHPVNVDNLRKHVEKISTGFGSRNWQNVENLNKVADYIKSEFSKTNSSVYLQKYVVAGNEYFNVISEYGSLDSEEVYVVGAHYDAHGGTPGADDNASGVAGLLELGRVLSGEYMKFSENLPFKVILVAYTLEEPPFFRTEQMGSFIHAKSLAESKKHVRLMISLEMIGFFSDAPDSQSYPLSILNLFYPKEGDFIAIVSDLSLSSFTMELKIAFESSTSLPVYSINAPRFLPGIDFSDHLNYWKHNFDAVMITDTAFYRNKEYHKAGDTAERLDYTKMADVVLGVHSFLRDRASSSF